MELMDALTAMNELLEGKHRFGAEFGSSGQN